MQNSGRQINKKVKLRLKTTSSSLLCICT